VKIWGLKKPGKTKGLRVVSRKHRTCNNSRCSCRDKSPCGKRSDRRRWLLGSNLQQAALPRFITYQRAKRLARWLRRGSHMPG